MVMTLIGDANKKKFIYILLSNLRSYLDLCRVRSKKGQIGLLQQTITWYKVRHAGAQAHCYSRTGTLKQRLVTLDWLTSLCFNVPVLE